jgi:hypothetical protein
LILIQFNTNTSLFSFYFLYCQMPCCKNWTVAKCMKLRDRVEYFLIKKKLYEFKTNFPFLYHLFYSFIYFILLFFYSFILLFFYSTSFNAISFRLCDLFKETWRLFLILTLLLKLNCFILILSFFFFCFIYYILYW